MHIVKRTGHPTEGHTIIYTCLHVIYKPQYTIIKYS